MSFIKNKLNLGLLFTIIKYTFAVALTILSFFTTRNITYTAISFVELALIFLIYNLIVEKNIICRILGGLLFFVFVAQMLVLYFGNSYVTLTMLKNLKFLADLGGKLVVYLIGVALVLLVVFLPGRSLLTSLNKRVLIGLICILVCAEVGISFNYKYYSPIQSFASLFADEIRYKKIQKVQSNPELALSAYYHSSIADAYTKPEALPENPNIIIIFTEGLSYNIINDDRNIMPNLRAFENSCLSFSAYFNHTFPTLRGVQGQLYSGYKLDDDALGNNLISVQDVLKDRGYSTYFINTEPYNEEFNSYLANLGFDQIITDTKHVSGYNISMTDAEAYSFLYAYAMEQDELSSPFFLGIYTFGTHVSFDSPDEVFDDGSNAELNKFYNLDAQFGKFIEAFNNSPLADDTLLIFTTDHSTYADQDYTGSFPNHKRACTDVDQIPLFIYFKGMNSEKIDVAGKNSLCLAPTILDYLDIDSENYFLGSSLFDKNTNTDFDTIFYDASYLMSTKNGELRHLSDIEIQGFLSQVLAYYSALEAERE